MRFHPPRTTGNVMVSDHFSRPWTLRTSIWHSKTKGSATSIFAFCKSRFTIGNIRCIPFFQSAKNAMRIRYARRAARLPKWSRDPKTMHLRQENKGFRDIGFHFLQFAIYHRKCNVYFTFARVQNGTLAPLCFPMSNACGSGPGSRKRCI